MSQLKRIESEDSELKLVANVWDGDEKVYRAEVDLKDVTSETLEGVSEIIPEQYRDYDKIVLTAYKYGEKIARVSSEDDRFASIFSTFMADIADSYGLNRRRHR